MTGPDFDPVVVRAVYPPPRRIAIIGLSDRIGRPSHDVAGALLRWGYEVVPVNLVVQDDCIGRRVGGWRRPPAATH